MRPIDEFEKDRREMRLRKIRRIFNESWLPDDDPENERPIRRFKRWYGERLRELQAHEKGKRPYAATPVWSCPGPAGRGRPISSDGRRIPHTRHQVGGHSTTNGAVAAIGIDRYNRRQEVAKNEDIAPVAEEQLAAIEAIDDDRYLNRLEREALKGGLPSALRTNMDPDGRQREQEWAARTRNERKPGKPRINILAERDPELCRRIAQDNRWPQGLRNAIASELDRLDRGRMRPRSKTAGEPWIDDRAEETLSALCDAYGLDPAQKDGAFSFGRPRAGRVFYTWVAELPKGSSEAERQTYLDAMEASLDAIGVSFVLVMHRPDPVNHPDNHHVHLIYSDRPVERDEEGRFDIETQVERDYGRGRQRVVHQRQPKLREVARRDWPQRLRALHVEHCNAMLESAQTPWRYHAGGFAEIGHEGEERQRKLGASAARYEAAGVPTEAGAANAFIEWDRVDRARERKHGKRMARIAALHEARLRSSADDERTAVEAWREAAERAEQARVTAEEAADTIAMALSRPRHAAEKSAAIAKAAAAGSYEAHRWTLRAEEAWQAMRQISADLAPEYALLGKAEQEAAQQARLRDAWRRKVGRVTGARSKPALPATEPVRETGRLSTEPRAAHRFIDRHERDPIALHLEKGVPRFPTELLVAEGVDQRAFDDPAVAKRMLALHARQQREIAAVAKLAAQDFRLDARSDTPHMRAMIARWKERCRGG